MRTMAGEGEQQSFGDALAAAIRRAHTNQAEVARQLTIDAGQVSRWVNDKALPLASNVRRLEELLGADLSAAFMTASPAHELYVAAPITGLAHDDLREHHAAVGSVVAEAEAHVNGVYWPGRDIEHTEDLLAPDIATERNMRVLDDCQALLYVQLAEIARPSSALVELGLALGLRKRTTVILGSSVYRAFMLTGFPAVAERIRFLPKARVYEVPDELAAARMIQKNGRELLGLA